MTGTLSKTRVICPATAPVEFGTVKVMLLLETLFTLTTTEPVVAKLGTGATIVVGFQLVGFVAVALKVTVLFCALLPKPLPLIVTKVLVDPEVGERLEMMGVTVNVTPLLAFPATVTLTGPVVAAFGTGAVILVLLQFVGEEAEPLNVAVLEPWVAPKFEPVIVIEVDTGPEVCDKPVIDGVCPQAFFTKTSTITSSNLTHHRVHTMSATPVSS